MLGDCPRVSPLETIVSHVTYGAITMCSVELMNCVSCSSRLKSFNAVFCCGILALQYSIIAPWYLHVASQICFTYMFLSLWVQ